MGTTERPIDRVERRLGGHRTSDDDAAATGAADGRTGWTADAEESDTSLSRWLPDTPSGGAPGWIAAVRADPGRAGVIGLGVLGAVAVLVTVFTLMSDDTPPVTSAKLPPVHMVSSEAPTPTAAPDAPVVVSVVGLVPQPGLVTLDPGARIADALAAAGGTLEGADLVGLNMARRVSDGEQIVVGIASPPGAPAAMGSSITTPPDASPGSPAPGQEASAPNDLVDLNTATVEQLDTLPGVGPVTAGAIVGWREANGRFDGVDQLGDVDGIGPARLEKLRGLVRV